MPFQGNQTLGTSPSASCVRIVDGGLHDAPKSSECTTFTSPPGVRACGFSPMRMAQIGEESTKKQTAKDPSVGLFGLSPPFGSRCTRDIAAGTVGQSVAPVTRGPVSNGRESHDASPLQTFHVGIERPVLGNR